MNQAIAMTDRFKLKSPNEEVHAKARAFSVEHGRVLVDNQKRLSLAVIVENKDVLKPLEQMGVSIVPDASFEMDTPG